MRMTLPTIVVLAWAQAAVAQWVPQPSGTTARLRGLSVVDERVAWASGAGGTVLRTVDGGATWRRRVVPDAERLDFRDIEAFDERDGVCPVHRRGRAVPDLQDDRRRGDLGAPARQP